MTSERLAEVHPAPGAVAGQDAEVAGAELLNDRNVVVAGVELPEDMNIDGVDGGVSVDRNAGADGVELQGDEVAVKLPDEAAGGSGDWAPGEHCCSSVARCSSFSLGESNGEVT